MGIRFTAILVIILLFGACTSNPRYRAGGQSIRQSSSGNKSTAVSANNSDHKKFGYESVQYGLASYYGPKFHGKITANGEIFDMYKVSAAHKYLPIGSIVKVTNLDNRKILLIRVNDRGPYIPGRILDCSYKAADLLGFVNNGTANIKLEVLEYGNGKR